VAAPDVLVAHVRGKAGECEETPLVGGYRAGGLKRQDVGIFQALLKLEVMPYRRRTGMIIPKQLYRDQVRQTIDWKRF
jgi:hypothetical protein